MSSATYELAGVTGDIDLPGLSNLRVTGAWEADGGTLVAGRLFRSDSPARLDQASLAALRDLGIDLAIDLRSEAEVAAEGYAAAGIERVGLPIELLDPSVGLTSDLTLASLYQQLIDGHGPTLAAAVRAIARHDGDGVLVHCTAGKDRTGVVVALTLLALGVDRMRVVADYAATHANLRGPWTEDFIARAGLRELPPQLLEILNASPAALLDDLIDHLEARHGGVVAYLRAHGLDDSDLTALRARLVTATTDSSQGAS